MAQIMLDLLLALGCLSALVPLMRGGIRKETIARQGELILALKEQNEQQAEQIETLQKRVRKLEGKNAWETRVVPKGPENRNGGGGRT